MKYSLSALLAAGLIIGVCVGIVGTGGAVIIAILVYIFSVSQLKAQGTALPIAAWPAWFIPTIPYWRAGDYDLKTAILLGIGIGLGGYFGAHTGPKSPARTHKKGIRHRVDGSGTQNVF